MPNTLCARCGPPSKVCATMPTKGIAGPSVLPTGVLQQVAYQRNSPFGVRRTPAMRFWPFDEGQRRRCNLDDVGAALRVEQIGAAKLVQEGLAVVAIADDAVDLLRRCVRHDADHLAAAAAYLHLFRHLSPPAGPHLLLMSPGWPRLTSGQRRLAAVLPEYFRQLMFRWPCGRAGCSHVLSRDTRSWRTDP